MISKQNQNQMKMKSPMAENRHSEFLYIFIFSKIK